MKSLYDLSAILVIGSCIIAGIILTFTSKRIDSPAEQVIEAVLAAEGIDVDFSEGKKADRDNEAEDEDR